MSRAGLWVVVAVVALSAILYVRYGKDDESQEFTKHPAVGKALPDLKILQLDRGAPAPEPIVLSDLSGKVALINIWGTWCGPCVQELPHVARLQRQFASRDDATVLPISYGRDGLASTDEELRALGEDTAAFLTQSGLEMSAYVDRAGETYMVLDSLLGPVVFPTNVVLDRQGIVRGVWQGYRPGMEREVERLVRDLIKEGPATAQ